MSQIKTISFIGGGRVTFLLLHGLNRSGIVPDHVLVYDPDVKKLKKLEAIDSQKIHGVGTLPDTGDADIIFLAIHPPAVEDVAQELLDKIKQEPILVSFVPSVSINKLSGLLGGFNRIVRMIPNAPSIIGKGYNPAAFSETILSEEKLNLLGFFSQWGTTPEVKEEALDAYAIITGMGPTYFWFQWLELKRLALEFGIDEKDAITSLSAMIFGAIDTLFYSCFTAEQVLDLIPAYPLKKDEEMIRKIFRDRLERVYEKIKL